MFSNCEIQALNKSVGVPRLRDEHPVLPKIFNGREFTHFANKVSIILAL